MTPGGRSRLRLALPLLGVGAGLALLHHLYDLGSIARRVGSAAPGWLAVALVLDVVAPLFAAVKVWSFVRVAGLRASLARCWSALLAAIALNAFLPGRGGDIVRAGFLAQDRGEIGLYLGVVAVERMFEVLALGLLSLAGSVALGFGPATILAVAASLSALFALLALALGHKLPFASAERIGRAARQLRSHPSLVALGFAACIATWICNVVLLGACLRCVGVGAPAWDILRAGPVAILAGILPVTVAGIGTRDTTLALLLGDDGDGVVAGAFLYTVISLWLQGLLGAAALGGESLRAAQRLAERPRDP